MSISKTKFPFVFEIAVFLCSIYSFLVFINIFNIFSNFLLTNPHLYYTMNTTKEETTS